MKLVYVHGAGRQENRDLLKRRLDEHLFGSNQLGRTLLAYYADVLNVEPALPDELEASPNPDSAAIAAAFEARAIEVAAAETPAVAGVESFGAGDEAELPDPAFLLLARIASRDVTAYLIDGQADAMRAPVRQAILGAGSPIVIVAHSLGTIVTFDVLADLGSGGPDVPLLVTVGSPLGISNVLRRLVGGLPPPPKVPSTVRRWANVADPFDPVALVPTLAPLFGPPDAIVDQLVDNRALLNHDLTGYLDTDLVRSLVFEGLGVGGQEQPATRGAKSSTNVTEPATAGVPSPSLRGAVESADKHRAVLLTLPNVVAVRGGYKVVNGRITRTPAVVVAVNRKLPDLSAADTIPRELSDGVATDVTVADPIERLSTQEAVGPLPRSRRPLLIDQLQTVGEGPADDEAFGLEAVPVITYLPPPGVSLDPVSGPMAVTCHVSPDAGWPVLRAFLSATTSELTLGMYDFTAPHIYRAARRLLRDSTATWRQTLGPSEALPAADDVDSTKADDKPEASVIEGLRRVAGARFDTAFAQVGKGKTFASAYHIKVAVRDAAAFWLSSGNWQSSNQPSIDFLDPDTDRKELARYNREWHVVVENAPLSDVFRRFLRHDFDTAAESPEAPPIPMVVLPDLLVPVEDLLELERAAVNLEVFPPARFEFAADDPLTIQPILTPDNYLAIVLDLLRQRPRERLYFQNQSLNPILEPTPEWAELLRLLAALSHDASLDVRIIIRNIGAIRKKLESLQAAGFNLDRVRVQVGCHTKGIVIDGETLLLGSHNWTDHGVQANRDASLLIRRPEIAAYYERVFLHDWDRLARPTIDEEAMPIPADLTESVGGRAGAGFQRVPWSAWEDE